MVRAGESLMKLVSRETRTLWIIAHTPLLQVSDLKQYLILNDFPSVNEAISQNSNMFKEMQVCRAVWRITVVVFVFWTRTFMFLAALSSFRSLVVGLSVCLRGDALKKIMLKLGYCSNREGGGHVWSVWGSIKFIVWIIKSSTNVIQI